MTKKPALDYPWRKIHFRQVRRLLIGLPQRLAWSWHGQFSPDHHLVIVNPHGSKWELKMVRGWHIRPLPGEILDKISQSRANLVSTYGLD